MPLLGSRSQVIDFSCASTFQLCFLENATGVSLFYCNLGMITNFGKEMSKPREHF